MLAAMTLFILRHGIAEDVSPSGSDADRRLTDEGRRKLRQVLAKAKTAGANPELMLTSPYVRARQTAEIAAAELGYSSEPSLSERLFPFSSALETWEEIRGLRGVSSVMLVGHNPHLSELATRLAGGAGGGGVLMKKAALARFDADAAANEPRGWLEWLLTAKTAG